MMLTLIVIAVVSGALLAGAAWGAYFRLGKKTEGFLVALAGGALLLSAVSELIVPSIEKSSVMVAMAGVLAGAIVFSALDYWIDEKVGRDIGWRPPRGGNARRIARKPCARRGADRRDPA